MSSGYSYHLFVYSVVSNNVLMIYQVVTIFKVACIFINYPVIKCILKFEIPFPPKILFR